MDGVLVDSRNSWHGAINEVLESDLGKEITMHEFMDQYWGYDLKYIFDELGIGMDIPEFCNDVYGKHTKNIEIYDDTKSTLRELGGYRKAVITNTPVNCTKKILEHFGILDHFDAIVTSTDVKEGKPDPEIIFKACEKLHVEPGEAVVIGDHKVDVEAARRAGCAVIGVGLRGDYEIERLSEMSDLIRELRSGE